MQQPEAKREARITELQEEMDSIHAANKLYWTQGETASCRARAKYQRRQERLEEIRVEMTRLRFEEILGELATRRRVG